MKLLIFLLAFSATCTAQTITDKEAIKLSKQILSIIKKNAFFSDSLNFENIEQDFEQHADTFDTNKEVGYYYTRLLNKAGDKHSFYLEKTALENFSQKQKENIGFNYKLLEGNIGYLNIPGFYSSDKTVSNDFANQINNAIRSLDSAGTIAGWIVDLQHNSGGDMWPMVAGLNPLIGNDAPGYFKKAGDNNLESWKNSSLLKAVVIKNQFQLKNPNAKIAVLYSKNTASSGEATAICFIGKPNAKSFGEVTLGLTTGNQFFPLGDGNMFVLATKCELDRNKKIYTGSITPDVLIEKKDDETIIAQAKLWLKE